MTNFDDVPNEINKRTNSRALRKQISRDSIVLEIHSPDVINLQVKKLLKEMDFDFIFTLMKKFVSDSAESDDTFSTDNFILSNLCLTLQR